MEVIKVNRKTPYFQVTPSLKLQGEVIKLLLEAINSEQGYTILVNYLSSEIPLMNLVVILFFLKVLNEKAESSKAFPHLHGRKICLGQNFLVRDVYIWLRMKGKRDLKASYSYAFLIFLVFF